MLTNLDRPSGALALAWLLGWLALFLTLAAVSLEWRGTYAAMGVEIPWSTMLLLDVGVPIAQADLLPVAVWGAVVAVALGLGLLPLRLGAQGRAWFVAALLQLAATVPLVWGALWLPCAAFERGPPGRALLVHVEARRTGPFQEVIADWPPPVGATHGGYPCGAEELASINGGRAPDAEVQVGTELMVFVAPAPGWARPVTGLGAVEPIVLSATIVWFVASAAALFCWLASMLQLLRARRERAAS